VQVVLGKYKMVLGDQGFLAEGSWSICRIGTDIDTGAPVAIQVYKKKEVTGNMKDKSAASKYAAIIEARFHRQIKVLKDLQKPFNPDYFAGDGKTRILSSNPRKLFVCLVDFSPSDCLEKYVVTEVGLFTLKTLLKAHYEANQLVKKDKIQNVAQAIVLAAGGLHEKGLVHMDIKPQNVMLFGDRWKFIDVDGCMPIGKRVSYQDSSLSFSPLYCAPEYSRFIVLRDKNISMRIESSLDAWGIGMTLTELACLEAPLKRLFLRVVKDIGSEAKRSTWVKSFVQTVGLLPEVPLPDSLRKFSAKYTEMIRDLLLMTPSSRLSMAQCLERECMKPSDTAGMVTWNVSDSSENRVSSTLSMNSAVSRISSLAVSSQASACEGSYVSAVSTAVSSTRSDASTFKGTLTDKSVGTSQESVEQWRKTLQLRDLGMQPTSSNAGLQKEYPNLLQQINMRGVVDGDLV